MLLSKLVTVLLLRVLVTKASLYVRDECSCQFFFAKQLLLKSKNLYAKRVVVSGSSLQTSPATPFVST